jgi:DNA (cytosine-5)-methyltransferase 1
VKKLNAIDLFAGGGGLSVGLRQAGFNVVGAVENNRSAIATYAANFPGTKIWTDDIRKVNGEDLRAILKRGKLDLLAGCPPCQGFTSLTRKYKREDPRNSLILEMLRIVEEIEPRAIMMENVPGLAERGRRLLTPFLERLRELGYIVNMNVLQVADYGVPQFRRRLVLLAGRGFPIPLPNSTHSKDGRGKPRWNTVRDAIGAFPAPVTFYDAKTSASVLTLSWHVVRNISELNKARLKATQPGANRNKLPEALRPPCHRGLNRGFTNVYGRMEWDQVAPTITGGCTTLSKGRFGHPEQDRTISVREAATLQTFPNDYLFATDYIDQVCAIIGNALPCEFAAKIAAQCWCSLMKA